MFNATTPSQIQAAQDKYEANKARTLQATREAAEPCPVCCQVGGYCGGSGHYSCGSFSNGRPVAFNDRA